MRLRRLLTDLWFRVGALLGHDHMERDLREEIAFHLEMEERKHRARGMSAEEAHRLARVKFGGEDRFEEQARRSWGVGWLQDLGGDVRFATRQLRRRPAFTLLAVLTLALGIGGTVAIFSVVDGLMLRPLPVRNEAGLRVFWMDYDWRGAEFDFARERVKAFSSLAAYSNDAFTLRTNEGSTLVSSTVASAELFDVLGAKPLLGRTFRAGEDRPGAPHVIVLSYGLWQQRFGGDPNVLGRSVDVDGRPTTIVGVMPSGFYFPTPDAKAWVPLDLDPSTQSYQGNGWLVLLGRVRAGVTDAQVHDDLSALAHAMGQRWTYPAAWDKTKAPHATPLRTYLLGDVRPALLLLLGAVALVLLMACANVAALILTRTADRTGEMSVRTALGAGRARLARQVLTESVLLGLLSGGVGTGLAASLFHALATSLPLQNGFAGTLSLHWSTLAAALALAVGAGAVISLVPVRGLLGGDLTGDPLGERTQSGGAARRGRLQASLVVSEVALAVTLATGAALLVRTVQHLRSMDPGLDPHGVLTVELLAPSSGVPAPERTQLLSSVLEQARTIPGVSVAGFINRVPARDGGWQATVAVADRPDLGGQREPNAYFRPVTPGTFRALGARLVEGRGVLPSDRADTRRIAIVNEAFAHRFWGKDDPVGKLITDNGMMDTTGGPIEVVGVLHDMAVDKLVGPAPPAAYYPWSQAMQGASFGILVVRTALDPAALGATIRSVVTHVDPRLTLGRMETMDDVLDGAISQPLRLRFFLGLFSLLGLVMGAVGIYGVVSYGVERRRGEIGIRLALGAKPGRLIGQVVGRGMIPVLLGVTGGLGVSWLASSVVARFLFGVPPTDPLSFTAAAAALAVAGCAAALVPALRAAATDPAEALRAE